MTPAAADDPTQPEDGAEPPFVLLRPHRPISSQAKGKAAYQRDVRRDAEQAFAGRSPLEGMLYARVVHLYRRDDDRNPDVDNLLKPALDALKGLVYRDDRAIRQCLVERIDLRAPSTISVRRQPPEISEQLLDLLDAEVLQITYIEVGHTTGQLLWFGPIREEAG